MKITDIKIGQKVKYQNQKWIGIVQDICDKFSEVGVELRKLSPAAK